MIEKFWDKVEKCKHEHLSPNFDSSVICCENHSIGCIANESHCLDCGVYITECSCGAIRGMSGWSHERWMRLESKSKRRRINGSI